MADDRMAALQVLRKAADDGDLDFLQGRGGGAGPSW